MIEMAMTPGVLMLWLTFVVASVLYVIRLRQKKKVQVEPDKKKIVKIKEKKSSNPIFKDLNQDPGELDSIMEEADERINGG